jgi:uncharacterized membrane protein YesL
MATGWTALKRALAHWWSELINLTLLNVIWLGCQLVVILGPPATATMYAVARRLAEGEHLFLRDVWADFKGVFWRAWQWGLVNLIVVGIALGNFYAYRSFSGPLWVLLRLLWGAILLGWLLVQVHYWPFFYEQEDRSFRTTLANSAKMLLLNSGLGLFIGLFSLGLAVVGILLGIPLGTVLMPWLALIGTYAVRESVAAYRQRPAAK